MYPLFYTSLQITSDQIEVQIVLTPRGVASTTHRDVISQGKLRNTALEFGSDGVLSGNFPHIATDLPSYEHDTIVYSSVLENGLRELGSHARDACGGRLSCIVGDL